MEMTSRQKAAVICKALIEHKALDLKVLAIDKLTPIADFFVIASGSSDRQLQAMADAVEESMSKRGIEPKHTEGKGNMVWSLMDYGDVVVHLFDLENRKFYDLDHIWVDGIPVDAEALAAETPAAEE